VSRVTRVQDGDLLVERDRELGAAAELIDRAADGDGSLLVIEGAAGAGKSRLLGEIGRLADERNLTVLSGRGSELERPFAFGVVRQALEPALAALDADPRAQLLAGAAAPAAAAFDLAPGEPPADPFVTLNGLFWLLAGLAERNPLLLALDDVQWADEASLRLLSFLMGRIDSIPALVAVAARPRSGDESDALVTALAGHADSTTLTLRPLGAESVGEVVAARLGSEAEAAFVDACLVASGGNPFLLVELLRDLQTRGARPTGVNATIVTEANPENVTRSVSGRLAAAGPVAAAVARALAIVGDGSAVSLISRTTELAEEAVNAAADALARSGLIAPDPPLRFVHPLLRTAVEATFTPGERLRMHLRAARLLEDAGAPPERVALHLLETEPAGDQHAAELLAAAGRAAAARGAPELGARLMRRALAEPPARSGRDELLFDLGMAEAHAGVDVAREHLSQVVAESNDPILRATALRELVWAVGPRGAELTSLLPLFDDVIDRVPDSERELRLGLEASRLAALFIVPGRLSEFEETIRRFRELPGDTPAECAVLGWVARGVYQCGGTISETAEVAERSVRIPLFVISGPNPGRILHLSLALITAERYETAERVLTEAMADGAAHGSASAFASGAAQRAFLRHAAGDLRGSEADAQAAMDSRGMQATYPFQSLIPITEALADQGKIAEADALLAAAGMDGELPPDRPYTAILIGRGRLRAIAGDLEAAHTDLTEARRRLGESGSRGIIGIDGRLAGALVANAVGDQELARELSDSCLEDARAWEGPKAIGGALRVAGLLRGGKEGLEMLREAVESLRRSPARLWRAEALVDYGAALRRANQRQASREPLREGIELAEQCGAVPLAQRARRELQASGGRVPQRLGGGVDELTPSELRVCELAAAELSNPQIAQQLFVTTKTVEMHLSNAYRKLEIRSRRELPAVLSRA
jgi:DNA-binding CsgD family transcriptional regulator